MTGDRGRFPGRNTPGSVFGRRQGTTEYQISDGSIRVSDVSWSFFDSSGYLVIIRSIGALSIL